METIKDIFNGHRGAASLAQGMAKRSYGISADALRESLTGPDGLAHKLQTVGTYRGVQYINDSRSTNVNSAWFALESLNKPLVWIAGGVDTGNDYTALKPLVKAKVEYLILLGQHSYPMRRQFAKLVCMVYTASTMADAVFYARQLANVGDCVLLSPACASFDMFENYADRGNQFINEVKRQCYE